MIGSSVEAKYKEIINKYTQPNGYFGTFTGRNGTAPPVAGGDQLFPKILRRHS